MRTWLERNRRSPSLPLIPLCIINTQKPPCSRLGVQLSASWKETCPGSVLPSFKALETRAQLGGEGRERRSISVKQRLPKKPVLSQAARSDIFGFLFCKLRCHDAGSLPEGLSLMRCE